jgi:hypothetical protein
MSPLADADVIPSVSLGEEALIRLRSRMGAEKPAVASREYRIYARPTACAIPMYPKSTAYSLAGWNDRIGSRQPKALSSGH